MSMSSLISTERPKAIFQEANSAEDKVEKFVWLVSQVLIVTRLLSSGHRLVMTTSLWPSAEKCTALLVERNCCCPSRGFCKLS